MDRSAIRHLLTACALTMGLVGCVVPAIPPPAPAAAEPAQPVVQSEVDLIRMSHSVTDALVAELNKNHPSFHRRKPILVASFVNRNALDDSSELGLLIADHVSSRFTQQGYTVVDPKLRRDLAIRKERGEFILSRDIDKLSQDNKAYAAVVGSYTETLSVLDFTAKIVQIKSRQVLASVDVKIPLGVTTRDLLINSGGGTSMPVVAR